MHAPHVGVLRSNMSEVARTEAAIKNRRALQLVFERCQRGARNVKKSSPSKNAPRAKGLTCNFALTLHAGFYRR
jgi:hypothetical protein